MTTYIATTTAEVKAMVAAASGGDSVLLAPGTYDNVKLKGVSNTTFVNIRSLDTNNPALLTGLLINDSSGLKFSNLEIQTSATRPFNVISSDVINFDSMDVHGVLNGSSQDDGTAGLLIRWSSYVNVTNSHFHEMLEGVTHLDSRQVTISSNAFDLIGNNAIDGGGTSQIKISNNTFTNFDHVGSAVHPDMIQFWTTNTDKAASDITISGNVFDRGQGTQVQGIWISDDVHHLPYENVTITNNTIVGAGYNGLVVSGAVNATIKDNVVIGTRDQPSWIGTLNVDSVTMSDNIASSYNFSNSNVTGSGDIQATVLSNDDDGSFPTWQSGIVVPAAKVSDQAQADILGSVSLLGYTDGPSTTGTAYGFDTITIEGTAGADRLGAGTYGGYHLYGYAGDDMLAGNQSGALNTLEGGTGNDTYIISQSTDVVIENFREGSDTVVADVDYRLSANVENIRAATGGLRLDGNDGNNSMTSSTGSNLMYGHGGNDTMIGNTGSDRFYGGDGNDRLTGNDGWDILYGGNGDDALSGGTGSDVIFGNAGNDYIEGGPQADTLTGGTGADIFAYRSGDIAGSVSNSMDTIKDFKASEGDKIGLSGLDANILTLANEAFQFIGKQRFHGSAGELRFAADGDGITVYGDNDGDKVADFAIHLTGLTTISASSFML